MDGLLMKYFVLKSKGNDAYEEASRKAMRAYSQSIRSVNYQLADEILRWADHEWREQLELEETKDDKSTK